MKFRNFLQLVTVSIILCAPAKAAEQVIKLRTDLTLQNKNELSNEASQHLATVQCILNEIRWRYEISHSPVQRNRLLTQKNEIDGFFLHAPDLSSDQFTKMSQPLAIERWYMFQKSKETNLEIIKPAIGAVLGSNEHRWLQEHDYTNIVTASRMASIVKMLHRGRILYAFADQTRFWKSVFFTETPATGFKAHFVRYTPLVMYFSNHFIEKNPNFLAAFNNNIGNCVQESFKPTNEEVYYLRNIQADLLSQNGNKTALLKLVKSALINKADKFDKKEEDIRWIKAALNQSNTPLMRTIEDNPLSAFLRNLTQLSSNKINEIFVMDTDGYIIGMNQPTSDYWQGDEAAFQAIMEQGRSTFVSEISFDASTQKFQIQVTIPLMDPKDQSVIALMTIGFDADKALAATSEF